MDEKIIAMVTIGALGIGALCLQLDGAIIYCCIAAIAGLAGFKPSTKT